MYIDKNSSINNSMKALINQFYSIVFVLQERSRKLFGNHRESVRRRLQLLEKFVLLRAST